jgi:hypothetical protein
MVSFNRTLLGKCTFEAASKDTKKQGKECVCACVLQASVLIGQGTL